MREILSFIFDRLTDPLGLPISVVWEYVILLALNGVAYIIAYSAVGDMYRSGNISSSTAGSVVHWVIRFIVFIIIWAIAYTVIWSVKFITAHWVAIFCILGGILFAAAVIGIIVIVRKKENRRVFSDNT